MSVLRHRVRRGAYADSIVLMQLQAALARRPGIEDAGAVMATAANLELLRANALLPPRLVDVRPDDLVVVVRAAAEAAAAEALERIDELMTRRREGGDDEDFRPRSLESAARLLPQAEWVLISVPGPYAAAVARRALDLGKHLFLYSDNVPLADEIALKRAAAERGLLVMGPDCGTAIVGGVGLGFANRTRRGSVGLVGASGTGLQAIASRLHDLGAGVSHALGTGGRDLAAEVGAITAHQALDLLARDPGTRVIVLVSKPPAPEVALRLLARARAAAKPVVVYFLGYAPPGRGDGGLFFAAGSSEAADLAVDLAGIQIAAREPEAAGAGGFVRGLFAGGTLAYEAQAALRSALAPLHSNVPILGSLPLEDAATSIGHTLVDLGADELTVGRAHPMIDPDLRLRRLRREAADPAVGVVLLDVVLGEGSHPDPAADLAPALAEALAARPDLEIVVAVIGTDDDPQDRSRQVRHLEQAGARVFTDFEDALARVRDRLATRCEALAAPVDAALLGRPVAALNVGLASFYDSLKAQGAEAVHVDWRPPAGGDERLAAILAKLGR